METSLNNVDSPRRWTKFNLLLLESPDISMCLSIPVKPPMQRPPNFSSLWSHTTIRTFLSLFFNMCIIINTWHACTTVLYIKYPRKHQSQTLLKGEIKSKYEVLTLSPCVPVDTFVRSLGAGTSFQRKLSERMYYRFCVITYPPTPTPSLREVPCATEAWRGCILPKARSKALGEGAER